MQSILCIVKEPFHLMYYNSPKTYGNTFKSSPFLCVSEQYPTEYRKVGITLHLFGYGDDPKKTIKWPSFRLLLQMCGVGRRHSRRISYYLNRVSPKIMTFLSQMLLEVALFVFLWFVFDLWRLSGKEALLTKLLEHKIAQFVPTNNIPYYFWAKPLFFR